MAFFRRGRIGGRDDNAKPAYALALLVALQFGIGATVQHWDAVAAVLMPVGAMLAVLILVAWIGAVVVDIVHVPVVDDWQYRAARRKFHRLDPPPDEPGGPGSKR